MSHTLHKYETDEEGFRWSVGYWSPPVSPVGALTYEWVPLLDFITMSEAAAWVSYLNGGLKPEAA